MPARAQHSASLKAIPARQLQAHVRQQPPLFAVVKGTIASKKLVVTYRAFLYIAADDMQLPFEHTAVVARLGFGSPVVSFGAVRDSGNLAAAARVGPNPLGLLNAIRPTCDHSGTSSRDVRPLLATRPSGPSKSRLDRSHKSALQPCTGNGSPLPSRLVATSPS